MSTLINHQTLVSLGGGGGGGGHERARKYLHVTELDAVQVEHTLRVSQDEGVEGKDLEHLQGGHQGAAALLYNMADYRFKNRGAIFSST